MAESKTAQEVLYLFRLVKKLGFPSIAATRVGVGKAARTTHHTIRRMTRRRTTWNGGIYSFESVLKTEKLLFLTSLPIIWLIFYETRGG